MKHCRWMCVGMALLGLAGCFGSGGVPSTDGTTGGNKPVIDVGPSPPPGGNDEINKKPPSGGDGGGGAGGGSGVVLIPAPQVSATLLGKPVVQDGLYAIGKLQAHAVDSKNQASTFHWILTGTGIADAVYGDGADFSYDLPAVTDKSAYELVVVGSLGGKAVQDKLDFFTVPAPTATITANVNQAAGIDIALPDKGAVLKGQKIVFSADTKFADDYKWQISKDNAAVADLGKPNAPADFVAADIGIYQVSVVPTGIGGSAPATTFNFTVKDNGVAVAVKSQVTKDTYLNNLVDGGQYPVKSTLSVDASSIQPAEALSSVVCALKNIAGAEQAPSAKTATTFAYALDTDDKYTLECAYTLQPGYAPAAGNVLSSKTAFTVLPKTKAVVTVDGNACDPNSPLLYTKGAGVKFDATKSTGNATMYTWTASVNNVILKSFVGIQYPLNLTDEGTYTIKLIVDGIGDSDPATCTVTVKSKPTVFFADDSTVTPGHSYILGSVQSAHADVTAGDVTDFVYDLLDAAKLPLVPPQTQTTQDPKTPFGFQLAASGQLNLKLQPKYKSIVGDPSYRPFFSKFAQVSLITPVDFSGIQSVANADNAYFASPSAIFHRGSDQRIIKMADISAHPASANGFFVRDLNDVQLLTTDGGVWRYSYDKGWNYSALGLPNNENGVVLNGISSNGPLLVISSSKKFYWGDAAGGNWKALASGKRYLTVSHDVPYIAEIRNIAKVPNNYALGSTPGAFSCSAAACTELTWVAGADPKKLVGWKSMGGSSNPAIAYLSDSTKNVYLAKSGKLSKLGVLQNDDYVVSYAKPKSEAVLAIGNKGGTYRLAPAGVSVISVPPPLSVQYASGAGSSFLVWNNVKKAITLIQSGGKLKDFTAQSALGTTVPANCAPQKMWMVGDTAYVSTCTVVLGKLLYTVWSAPYVGDFSTDIANFAKSEVVMGIASDGANGILIARSDANNINYVQHFDSNGAPVVPAPTVLLNAGEHITGLSGKFLITNQGIWVMHNADYLTTNQVVPDAQHLVAVGDVLYYSHLGNTRLARYDAVNNQIDELAPIVDPLDPIVDIVVDGSRVYVLTAKALYRSDAGSLTKIYDSPGGAPLMNAMALMNGNHFLLSLNSKGLKLVDKDGKEILLNQDAIGGLPLSIQSVGYNGTEFLFYGYDTQTKALFIHQFGAPQ